MLIATIQDSNKAAVGDIIYANKDCSGTSDSALAEPVHDVDTSYQTTPISADAAPHPQPVNHAHSSSQLAEQHQNANQPEENINSADSGARQRQIRLDTTEIYDHDLYII